MKIEDIDTFQELQEYLKAQPETPEPEPENSYWQYQLLANFAFGLSIFVIGVYLIVS